MSTRDYTVTASKFGHERKWWFMVRLGDTTECIYRSQQRFLSAEAARKAGNAIIEGLRKKHKSFTS